MTWRAPGTLRVLQLLAVTSLRRLLRAAKIQQAKRAAHAAAAGPSKQRRGATARKRTDGLMWLLVLMLPIFLFQAVVNTGMAVGRLQQAANTVPVAVRADQATALAESIRRRHEPTAFLAEPVAWQRPEARDTFVNAGAVLLLALTVMFIAIGFGGANANLAGGEWTQAWLMTFPVPTRSLVLAKVLEYGLVVFMPWLTFCPLLWQLLRALAVPGAIWVALGATLVTTLLVGAVRLWAETKLRMVCTLHQLRSVQGVCTIVALALMTTIFAICLGPKVSDHLLDIGRRMPGWIAMLPGSWPLALADHGLAAAAIGIGTTVAAMAAAVIGSCRLLQSGVMRSGGVDAGHRGQRGLWRRARRLTVAGKDVALLLRDRNFLVQTVLVPVFIIGMQLVVNPGLGKASGNGIAPLAYGVGFYAAIAGCFQVLSGEGRALWMLYALPTPIAQVLQRKTRIWATLAVVYGFTALVAFTARTGEFAFGAFALDAVSIAIGTWCAAHLAAGISILACNPAADHVPRQAKARHIYLYLFFASTYLVGLASSDWSVRITAALVFVTLAYSMWQRACDRLPHLLDPVVEPRDQIAVHDGAAAIVVFFLGQSLLLAVLLGGFGSTGTLPTTRMLVAFVVGGAVTVVLFVALLNGRGVDVPAALGLRASTAVRPLQATLLGAAAGAGLALIALGYLAIAGQLAKHGWFELPPKPDTDVALLLLVTIGAPLSEELLFRGLLLGGLLRSVRPLLAIVWSAALFASMHPLLSWAPVFLLGIGTAMLRWRTRFLPAAMAMHAVYNLIVVTGQ